MMRWDSSYDCSTSFFDRGITVNISKPLVEQQIPAKVVNLVPDLLTQKELQTISQTISQDFSPVYSARYSSMIFSSRELLDISEFISLTYQPQQNKMADLMMLPVDPSHLYIYWDLPKKDNRMFSVNNNVEDFAVHTLRVYLQNDDYGLNKIALPWFDVAIEPNQHQQQITIPPQSEAFVVSATLGYLDINNQFVPEVTSNTIQVPCQDGMVSPSLDYLNEGVIPVNKSLPIKVLHASGQRQSLSL